MFDYDELTDIEKNVFRRIIPFWTWSKKNAELWGRMLITNPGKFGAVLKGMRDLQRGLTDMKQEDINALPAWAKAGFAILSGTGNDARSITNLGTPVEAFADFVGTLLGTEQKSRLSLLGPIPKGIVETGTGISLFTGKPIRQDTSGKAFRRLPKFIKDAIGYREVQHISKRGQKYTEYIVDPYAKYVLNLFLGRGVSFINKLSDLQDNPDALAWLNLMSGIKAYQFDISEEQAKREREAALELLKYLERKGYAKEFTVPSLTLEAKEKINAK